MKKERRTKLRISKHIRGISFDEFTVVVKAIDASSCAEMWKARGYKVSKITM